MNLKFLIFSHHSLFFDNVYDIIKKKGNIIIEIVVIYLMYYEKKTHCNYLFECVESQMVASELYFMLISFMM
jgi:hypothetical protein